MDICRIFFSWQSDVKQSRSFISNCLKKIPQKLKGLSIIEIDRDTEGIAGSPNIEDTIFNKIDSCDIFVADITIINKDYAGRKTPNPNVLIELGYAIKALGWDHIILLYDEEYGSIEELPFDINHQRMTKYSLSKEEKEDIKGKIAKNISLTIEILKERGMLHGGQPIIVSARNALSKMILESMQQIFLYYNERHVQGKDEFTTDFVVVTDAQFNLLDSIRTILTESQYFELTRLLQKLKMVGVGSTDAYGWEYAEEVADKYFERLYREYGNQMAEIPFEQVLTKEFIELYNVVVGKEWLTYSDAHIVNEKMVFADDGNNQEAWSVHGELLCKGKLETDGFTGYKSTTQYKGEFLNSMRHGIGDELSDYRYRYCLKYGDIRRSGEWRENQFVEGIIHNVVVRLNDDGKYSVFETDVSENPDNKEHDLMTADSDAFQYTINDQYFFEYDAEKYYFADVQFKNYEFDVKKETVVPFLERYKGSY